MVHCGCGLRGKAADREGGWCCGKPREVEQEASSMEEQEEESGLLGQSKENLEEMMKGRRASMRSPPRCGVQKEGVICNGG